MIDVLPATQPEPAPDQANAMLSIGIGGPLSIVIYHLAPHFFPWDTAMTLEVATAYATITTYLVHAAQVWFIALFGNRKKTNA